MLGPSPPSTARLPRWRLDLKSGWTYRAYPVLDLSRRLLVHIKEVRHCRSHGLDARIIEFHANLAMKNLEQGAVPKLHSRCGRRAQINFHLVHQQKRSGRSE